MWEILKQMGKRCEGAGVMAQETGGGDNGTGTGVGKLKEDHIFGEIENIVHVIGRKDVGIWRRRA